MAIDWDKTIVLQDDDSVDIISGRTVLYMNSLTEPMPGPAQGYVRESVIAEEFDETKTYQKGDYVFHDGKLYRFIISHVPGSYQEWTPSHVEEIVVANEFIDTERLENSLSDYSKKAIIAPEFDKDTAYSVGDYVFHDDKLYIFTSNHIAGAIWDSSIVLEKTISEQFIDYYKLNGSLASYVPKSDIAETFDAQESYAAGDFVYYNGTLYRFTQAHVGTAWNPAHVVAVTVGEEIIPDAPSNGKTYGRKDGAWAEAVTDVKWGDITGRLQDQSDVFYMRNYYVDGTNGSDDNAGTSSQPFKTVAKAVQSIPYTMQGKVHIAAGNYNENFAYEDKDINFYIEGNVNFTHNMGGVIRRSKTRFIGDVQVFPQLSFKNNLQIYDSDVTFYAVDLAFTGLYNWESTYYAVAAYRSHVILGTILSAQLYSKVGGYSVIHALHSYVQVDLILGSSVKATNLLEAGENAVVAYKTDTYPASADVDNYEHAVYNGRIIHGAEVESYSKSETDTLLAGKQNTLTFDSVPTENSTNPVTSDGIKTALDSKSDPVTGTASGSIVTLTDAADAPVSDMVVAIEPVQEGTGDPSPSNVRAITGWDECKVVSTGKNIYPVKIGRDVFLNNGGGTHSTDDDILTVYSTSTRNSGVYSRGGGYSAFDGLLKFLDGLFTYSFDIKCDSSEGKSILVGIESYGRKWVTVNDSWQRITITATFDKTYKPFCVYTQLDTSTTIYVKDFQLELGSSATAYEPYNGQTVTINLGGTRYGGRLNVTSGVLTVTHGIYTFTGSEEWTKQNNNKYYSLAYLVRNTALLPKTNNDSVPLLTSIGSFDCSYNGLDTHSYTICIARDGRFGIHKTLYQESDTLKDVQVVYELPEPITVQLTPTEVKTLLGLNNIWADTGDASLTYWKVAGEGIAEAVSNAAAVAKYDDGQTRAMITNSIEATTTASKSYSAGNLIILNGQLLRATTGIGIGGTITIGSNAEVITLETILAELSA